MTTHLLPGSAPRPALVLHGGAGAVRPAEDHEAVRAGLERAHRAGRSVLAAGGSSLDAVVATVVALEDDPHFNAGLGSVLTADGRVETDAAVMTGSGHLGAVTCCRGVRNPVRAARAVLDHSPHVLVACPPPDLCRAWGLSMVAEDELVTPARRDQLARVLAGRAPRPRHGTVGAVALDSHGHVAAATSTGGIVAKEVGRIGDSPVPGAGTFARDSVVAVSCTGDGEAFLEGVVAHEVDARLRLASPRHLSEVLAEVLDAEVTSRGATGGIIAVTAAGEVASAHTSPAMALAWGGPAETHTRL